MFNEKGDKYLDCINNVTHGEYKHFFLLKIAEQASIYVK